jgi:predicted trehalose synthase
MSITDKAQIRLAAFAGCWQAAPPRLDRTASTVERFLDEASMRLARPWLRYGVATNNVLVALAASSQFWSLQELSQSSFEFACMKDRVLLRAAIIIPSCLSERTFVATSFISCSPPEPFA